MAQESLQIFGNHYVLCLRTEAGQTSFVEIESDGDAPNETILVPSIDEHGLPSVEGHPPNMEDLRSLAELHGRYCLTLLLLARGDALDELGDRYGYAQLSDGGTFDALRVLKRADEDGILADLVASLCH